MAQLISATTYPRSVSSGVSLVPYASLGTLIGAGSDENNSTVTNIGFDFWFNGVRYTQFAASTNGYIKFGSVSVQNFYNARLSNGIDDPKVAPFMSDLTTGSNGYVRYGLNGTAPNRTLIVEWKTNAYSGTATSNPSTMIMQAILSETTGKIQYIYGSAMSPNSGGYSIGFASSSTKLLSINTSTDIATYGTDPNNTQTTGIASGKSYSFTPLVPTAPTGLTFTNVDASSMTLNWIDNASNEVGYVIYSSTDNVNFAFNTQLPANSTNTTLTGLLVGTNYYYKVYAVTEGSLSSPVLVGAQATLMQVVLPPGTTWIAPSCVTSITVETWGAGGGGGSSNNTSNRGGSGGGGGAYAKGIHTVIPGGTYYYSIGAGGTGGPANSKANATAGASSWFNATVATNSAPTSSTAGTLADGGGRGFNNNNNTPNNRGLAGLSFGNNAVADGSNGFPGFGTGGGKGGDGAIPGGAAGGDGSTNANGSNGTAPGGGGGGSDDNRNYKGGNGGSGQVVISYSTPTIITTYNGTTWDYGTGLSKIGIIAGSGAITTDTELCSCTVNTGVVATVNSGVTLKLQDNLTVNGTGTLTFENNASLVQVNDNAINTEKIYYKRHTTAVRRYDYTYWSSPVQPQTMIALSPNTLSDKFWSFDSDANDWVLSDGGGATMEPANGYSIRAPQTSDIVTAAIDTNPTFFGVPNNGNYTVSSTATAVNNKSYLLGNPYPSALDAITFLNNNSVLDGTLYFWTHNSNVTAVGAFYEYSDNDYATFNLTGGTGVASTNPGVSTSPPTGKIAAGQGFFATGIATGPINFTNAMRVGVGSITGDNSQFFRTTKTKAKTTTAIEKNRVWLNLYNTKGAFKQALIGYVTGATNAYDSGYDGESFDGNEFVDFYSVTPENYLVIQGRALPFDETDTVPLGYRSKEEMNLNISIDQTDGVLATQNIYIEDKLLNVIHNIKDTPYAFTTEAGTFDNRFVLRYTDKTLGNTDFEGVNSSVVISKDKNELKIKSEIETIKRITVYDLLGKKVFEKEAVNSTEFRSSAIGFSQQIGIVKVTLDNGQVISKKVIF